MESQIVITEQVSTFTTENIRFEERLVELESNGEILQSFIKNAQACVSPSSGQMELSSCFFLLLDRHIEIAQRSIEVMHLEVQQASEEVQTRLLLLLAATLNCYVEELTRLVDFLVFGSIINILILK